MSLATIVPAAVLETILTRLAQLFLAGADGQYSTARQAAFDTLSAYHPRSHEELDLAASIIACSFQALEALAQAADPDIALARVLRLRSGAVSLSREAERARRNLAQLRKDRPETGPDQQPKPPVPDHPAVVVRPTPPAARPQTEEDRQRDLRIAAGLKRMEARAAGQADAAHAITGDPSTAAIRPGATTPGALPSAGPGIGLGTNCPSTS